jgi:uncharacterized membrane protein
VDSVDVSTVVYVSPEEIYEFLMDFPGYARYSKYLTDVEQRGDGSPGTKYALRFAWWKLSYTARSEVVAVDRPNRIDWKITKDLQATGHWRITERPEQCPDDEDHATEVRLTVEFDPGSASDDALDLPRLVSMDWVIDKVKPLIQEEAERVVERIVADLEGRRRDVELTIHTSPDAV